MAITAYLAEVPRPYFIAAMVFGFIWHWPIGLVVLTYLIVSGRMRRRGGAPGRWHNTEQQAETGLGFGRWGRGPAAAASSSNRAFDDYRADTLRRLEEEQKEFMEYLERLRQARDKQEFDSFMADRRRAGPAPETSVSPT